MLNVFSNPRKLSLLAGLLAIAVVIIGVAIEHIWQLHSCPLCTLQRIAFVACGSCFLAGFWLFKHRITYLSLQIIASASSIAGLSLAIRQVYLQLYPLPYATCGINFDYIIYNFPLAEIFSFIMSGSGGCQEQQLAVLGISIPIWSTGLFIILLATSGYLIYHRLITKLN